MVQLNPDNNTITIGSKCDLSIEWIEISVNVALAE